MRLSIIFWLCVILGGCEWKTSDKPSILLIAVDSLGFQQIRCTDKVEANENLGIQVFCRESVRFSHAYTPSPMAQSALASILTGSYPQSHGVWHNGSNFVSAKVTTIAEAAVKNGYRTAFYSGGAPIWSKSGLRQGFEIFDDNFAISLKQFYRPAVKSFNLFLDWLSEIGNEKPFFAVIYLPDLQFEKDITYTDFGEIRNRSLESQVLELDESLGALIKKLKNRKVWHKTYVALTGLSGISEIHNHEVLKPYNLFSENTQVSLFLKPIQKNRDRGVGWKIDNNVSLVDLGQTLYRLVGSGAERPKPGVPKAISLHESFRRESASWPEDRLILTTTGWPKWLGWGGIQSAVRSEHYLAFLSSPIKVYNMLIDRLEGSPTTYPDIQSAGYLKSLELQLEVTEFPSWENIPDLFAEKLLLARQLWKSKGADEQLFSRLQRVTNRSKLDEQLYGWSAIWAVKTRNWGWLKRLGEKSGNDIWTFIAKRALGQKTKNPSTGCFSLLNKKGNDLVEASALECDDDLFVELLLWIDSPGHLPRGERHRESFYKSYELYLVDQSVRILNYINYLAWDVDRSRPKDPSNTELLLSLPENKVFYNLVRRRLQ